MNDDMYSVDQVAERLGLHVRTVRGYIRTGRLKAVRIGKQYRIARADLDDLLGRPEGSRRASVEVSSVVQLDGVGRAAADRLSTLVLASVAGTRDQARPLRVQTMHDEEHDRMKIVVFGSPGDTAELLRLLDVVLDGDNGLLTGEGRDA